MSEPNANGSIKRFHPRPRARLRLFCFPWAGVGASAYFRWSRSLPDEIEVLSVQYPGREDRWREPGLRRIEPLVELLGPDLAPFCDRPFAFWGHSMGALVAFELARQQAGHGGPSPRHLFVSGRQAPQLVERREPIPDVPDAEFIVELQRRYGGVPDAIARDPEVRALYLPTIRADLELVSRYTYQPGPPLACGLSVFGGLADHVSRVELEAWQTQTTGSFRIHLLPGDHFFVTTQTEAIFRRVKSDLQEVFPTGETEDTKGTGA